MNAGIFLEWLEKVFEPSLPNERPCLLLINVKDSIINYDITRWLLENQVILIPIPCQAQQVLQPLCASVLPALRAHFYELAEGTLGIKQGETLNKCDLAKLWADTLSSKCTPSTIKDAFRLCGISKMISEAAKPQPIGGAASAETQIEVESLMRKKIATAKSEVSSKRLTRQSQKISMQPNYALRRRRSGCELSDDAPHRDATKAPRPLQQRQTAVLSGRCSKIKIYHKD